MCFERLLFYIEGKDYNCKVQKQPNENKKIVCIYFYNIVIDSLKQSKSIVRRIYCLKNKSILFLGSSSYLTDINGVPTHYYGYLPFTSLMLLFVLVFGALREVNWWWFTTTAIMIMCISLMISETKASSFSWTNRT